MVTRAELVAHHDTLTAAGFPPECWAVPIADRAVWTSDDPTEQRDAARRCAPCPALTACRAYGLEHHDERGVYGALTETERRPRKPSRKDEAA